MSHGIYQVTSLDNTTNYFESRAEADAYWNAHGGRLQFIAFPKNPRELMRLLNSVGRQQ